MSTNIRWPIHTVRRASELAARIRTAALVSEKKWSCVIYLPRNFFDESIECGKIILSPCAVTELGEVARIDDHLLDGMAVRLFLQEMLSREIEPFIIGVGKVRVIRKHPFDGLIILAVENAILVSIIFEIQRRSRTLLLRTQITPLVVRTFNQPASVALSAKLHHNAQRRRQ
jgi:hypothetical protein